MILTLAPILTLLNLLTRKVLALALTLALASKMLSSNLSLTSLHVLVCAPPAVDVTNGSARVSSLENVHFRVPDHPRTNLSISDSPSSLSGTSSIGSIDSPLSSFIAPDSFIPGLQPSFSANHYHRNLPFPLPD